MTLPTDRDVTFHAGVHEPMPDGRCRCGHPWLAGLTDHPTRFIDCEVHTSLQAHEAALHPEPSTPPDRGAALREALALLSSMVASGEQHSEESRAIVRAALAATPAESAGLDYEARVKQMAVALHEDCRLEWRAIAVVDPKRAVTMHFDDAHYGQAHDLVRRIFPELDRARLGEPR